MSSDGSDSSDGDDAPSQPPAAAAAAERPHGVAAIFLGKRDCTTRESAKADRHAAIRKTMRLNPGWMPLDGIGHRVHVDAKTNEVKRVVPSREQQQLAAMGGAGGGVLRGDAAKREFGKPIGAYHEEYERLAAMGVSCDPARAYVMNACQAHAARQYVSGRGGGEPGSIVARDVEYDRSTHIASGASYRMFRGGVGFVHTNGAVSRVHAGEGGSPCACGMRHLA